MNTAQKEKTLTLGLMLALELEHEAVSTRKMLERLPADKLAWQPHTKSMTLGQLAGHIVEMVSWTGPTLTQDELDFATMGYKPKVYTSGAELVADLDKNVADALAVLHRAPDESMAGNWTLRNGAEVYFTMPKATVMRSFVMNHIIHHRGQLTVYLRLLDIPVPSVYGPSADEAQ